MIGSYSSNKSPATVRKTPERKLKVSKRIMLVHTMVVSLS